MTNAQKNINNINKLNRMLKHCDKIKEIHGGMLPINYVYDSVQSYIIDRVNLLEEQIKSVINTAVTEIKKRA